MNWTVEKLKIPSTIWSFQWNDFDWTKLLAIANKAKKWYAYDDGLKVFRQNVPKSYQWFYFRTSFIGPIKLNSGNIFLYNGIHQLRWKGVLEGIRICSKSFLSRVEYAAWRQLVWDYLFRALESLEFRDFSRFLGQVWQDFLRNWQDFFRISKTPKIKSCQFLKMARFLYMVNDIFRSLNLRLSRTSRSVSMCCQTSQKSIIMSPKNYLNPFELSVVSHLWRLGTCDRRGPVIF